MTMSPAAKHRQATKRLEKRLARTPEELAQAMASAYPDGHRSCSTCKRRLPLRQFPVLRSMRDGAGRFCLDCQEDPA